MKNFPRAGNKNIKPIDKHLVSVVIVNWNGQKWLKRCLDSLISQTYKELEIIVVDNNSQDQSKEFLKNNYSQIVVVESESNLGFAGGNNLGLKHATGEYILMINNDTWVETGFIGDLITALKKNKLDVISPREKQYETEEIKLGEYSSTIDILGHPVYRVGKSRPSFYLTGVCLLFKAKLYEETHGFDDNFFMYNEEVDWFWRLNLLKKTFAYSENTYIHHAGAGSSGDGIKYNIFLWRNQNTLQMLLKNYELKNFYWIVPLYLVQNVIEMVFFLITFKPKIAYSYIQGWLFNLRYFKEIMLERAWVQANRKIGDREIIGLMYIGSAKIRHLIKFLRTKRA